MMVDERYLGLAVAALGGLAVGVEREWSARRDGEPARFAGVRTFLLLGLLGGMGAFGWREVAPSFGLAILAASFALVAIAYAASAAHGTIDATTEVAGVLTVAAGALAGFGDLGIASALFAATALVLVEKSRLHAAVAKLESVEIEAGARFAVLALVVLPLLPKGPYGPGIGFSPQRLWALVLVFAGLSFAAYVALKIAGPGRGYGVAGLLGGLVSSTAVTFDFARESRTRGEVGRALAIGVIAASTVLYLRVGVLATALAPALGPALAPLALPLVVGGGFAALALRRGAAEKRDAPIPAHPLRLTSAIQMALVFQLVLFALGWARQRFGGSGVVASAALVGLTDLDSITFSVAEMVRHGEPVEVGACALVVGTLSNTLFKLALAMILGRGEFRRVAAIGLGVVGLATAGALALMLR
jgi:uncharacterized membrane protein (DUF4010 family)